MGVLGSRPLLQCVSAGREGGVGWGHGWVEVKTPRNYILRIYSQYFTKSYIVYNNIQFHIRGILSFSSMQIPEICFVCHICVNYYFFFKICKLPLMKKPFISGP